MVGAGTLRLGWTLRDAALAVHASSHVQNRSRVNLKYFYQCVIESFDIANVTIPEASLHIMRIHHMPGHFTV